MFDNKIVLVTGGSRGIGKAVAIEFAKANATVLINYTSSDDAANKAIEEMKSINQGELLNHSNLMCQTIKKLKMKLRIF